MDTLAKDLPSYKLYLANSFPLSIESTEKMLNSVGFRDISLSEVEICLPLPSLDAYLRWFASTIHVTDYTTFLNELRGGCVDADLSGFYDDQGRVIYKHKHIFGYCKK